MTEPKDDAIASAEKAYAEAAQAVPVKDAPAAAAAPEVTAEVQAEPVAETPVELPLEAPIAFPAKAKRVAAKKAPAPAKAPAQKKTPAPKPVAAPAKATAAAKPAALKKAVKAAIAKTVTKKAPAAKPSAKPETIETKEKAMATKKTPDFQAAIAGVQAKAKEALEKGTAAFGEANEFTKGNIEAVVESGKILGAGLKDMGSDYVTEAKTAFETMVADAKGLAAVKSPADFFKLQSEMLRRNFDTAVAYGSKSSETMMKLANDAVAPLSSRVSVAVAKVKQAA